MSQPTTAGTARPTLSDLDALVTEGRIDLVTSDVFDTLVTRDAARPSDVFVDLGHRLADDGLLPDDVDANRFHEARRNAERVARRRLALHLPTDRAAECTIEEVWREMPLGLADRIEDMVERELECEADRLHPIDPAIESLRRARAAGVRVVLVSDTYLAAGQLARLLVAAGVPGDTWDDIVTSSDRRRCKADGLLGLVVDGTDPARVVHVGDNPVADVATAESLGVTAVHVELDDADVHVERPSLALRYYSRRTGTDGGSTAAMRRLGLAAGADGVDPAWQFGALALGPAITGFVRWVADCTEELGATTVHCLLREGGTIADLIDVVAPKRVDARRVHASRWVDMRAAVIDGTIDEVRDAIVRRGTTSAAHVERAFGVDAAVVRAAWDGRDAVRPDLLDRYVARLLDHDGVREQIVAASAELRGRVLRQLDRELIVEPGRPLVLCDVGWGGSIQQALVRILRSAGSEQPVVGLYFALSATGEERAALGASMRSYLPSILDDEEVSVATRTVAHHADSIERVLTPPIGTFIDVTTGGEPVVATDVEVHPPSLQRSREGLMSFALDAAEHHPSSSRLRSGDPAYRAMLAETLADVIAHPSPGIAEALLEWPHDDVGGEQAGPLGGTEIAEIVRWSNLRDIESLRRTEPAWIEGIAAATNPALAAQIAAARHNLPAGDLVPPSPCGVSRLSAFPIGSDLAEPQVAERLATHPDGWSVLRLRGPYESLRAIRFDAGDVAALVQFQRFDIAIRPVDGPEHTVRTDDLRAGAFEWVDARPVAADRYAEHSGGHLVVPIAAEIGAGPGDLDVIVVFRRWLIDADDPALRPDVRTVARGQVRRARRAIRRLLG